jgi:YD repeat-containing protein
MIITMHGTKIIFIVGFLFSMYTMSARAQDQPDPNNFSKIQDVLNPSPEAASLGKYGGIPINLSSGAMNLEIPLFTYSSTNLSIPISLLYNSNSIHVNDISPSVGTSWALSAGGVITRTVLGMPDEFKSRIAPPASFPSRDNDYINFLYNLGTSQFGVGVADGQPDLFSFNFGNQNGKFILDSALSKVVLLTYSGLKIETKFSLVDASDWEFRITTPDGVQYYFGGPAVENTHSREVSSDMVVKNEIPSSLTSFYLNKIIHPNHDTIYLSYMPVNSTYIDNISETMFGQSLIQENDACPLFVPVSPPQNSWIKASNTCTLQGVVIQHISSSGGSRVDFNYINRKDDDQVLLSSIMVYQPGHNDPYKKYSLNYQYAVANPRYLNSYQTDTSYLYRPFLTQIIEASPDSQLTKSYKFNYNDAGSLPPRLSYAQDHYGFYNGKVNNSSLLPTPTVNTTWQSYMPEATANRDIDTNYCLKGLLTNVIYPTGGMDSIVYESNSVYGQVAVEQPATSVPALAVGSGRFGTPVDDTVVLQFGQVIRVNASCYYTQDPPTNPDPAHDLATLTVTCIAGRNSGEIFLQQNLSPGDTYNSQGNLILEDGTYVIESRASGNQVVEEATTTYIPGPITYVYKNTVVGGNRVKKILSIDQATKNTNIKRYFYGPLTNLQSSSAILMYSPIYERPAKFYYDCRDYADGQLPLDDLVQEYDFPCLYSNSQSGLNAYSNSPVSYSAVTESNGENFENGGVEHHFTNDPDLPGEPFQGDFILEAPRTSYAYVNGRETYQYTFKNVTGGFIPVKKVYTDYKQDARRDTAYSAYVDRMNYVPIDYFTPPDDVELNGFNLTIYQYLQKWLYADTIRTLTYDASGQNYTTDTMVSRYDNPLHALPTKITQSTSDGNGRSIFNYYPYDLTLTGAPEVGRQNLIANYIISPVLQQVMMRGLDTAVVEKTDYNLFPNGLTLPQTHNIKTGRNALEPRVSFYNYNSSGKILEQGKVADQHTSYIWDYLSVYPIAKVVNASSSDIAYTSFEADGAGNYTIGAGTIDSTSALTGRKCYSLTGSITKSGLNGSTTYIVSYWTKNSSPFNISGTLSGYPVKGKTISLNNANWTLYVHKVTGQSTITINGSGPIDELRLYPAAAQMTTYTYNPLVGITSQTDVGNRVTYYEYDGLSRLKRIRDQDYNILKTYDYQYQAPGGCGSGCSILTMQTLAGTGTIGYPVGVFNVHGKLIGNASIPTEFVSLWNNDTADTNIGTLAAGGDALHFNLTLQPGKTAPAGVTGCRFYQYDLPWTSIDGVQNGNAAYIDWGDGENMALAANSDTPNVLTPHTSVYHLVDAFDNTLYIWHSYSSSNPHTLTFYHNDGTEAADLDNGTNPATSLTKLQNLRGNLPQHTTAIGGSSYQQASALTVANIANWNTITSITGFWPHNGDGVNGCENMSYAQDFMQNNTGLQVINSTRGHFYQEGYQDSTFKLSRLKSDWNTYFTQLNDVEICDEHWNHEDLTALIHLKTFVLEAGSLHYSNDPTNNPIVPIATTVIDNLINQIAAGAGKETPNGIIYLITGGTTSTTASAAAVAFLQSRGWTVSINSSVQ